MGTRKSRCPGTTRNLKPCHNLTIGGAWCGKCKGPATGAGANRAEHIIPDPAGTFGGRDALIVAETMRAASGYPGSAPISRFVRSGATQGCTYGIDEDGDQYVTVAWTFATKADVYAELEDGTYGTLYGLRTAYHGEMPDDLTPGDLSGSQAPTEFDQALDAVANRVQRGDRPDRLRTKLGHINLTHVNADDDEEGIGYTIARFELPDGVFAEIDGDTYSRLVGVRIFHDGN